VPAKGFGLMFYFLFEFVPKYLPYLLQGALVTLELCFCSMTLAIMIGIACAIATITGGRLATWLVGAYVSICRGVPLIVILLFIYFTLPDLDIRLPAFAAGVVGLSINLGAYLSEVFRAAILAVDVGQMHAGLALGMRRWTIYRKVILPQAALIAVPTVGGYFISLLKDCALVSFISVEELLRHGNYIISQTFRTMETYLLVGAIYYVMSLIAARVIRALETHLRPAYLNLP
jgi:polar amino acid transport system permease protein